MVAGSLPISKNNNVIVETGNNDPGLLFILWTKMEAMARAIEKSETVIQIKETTFVEQLLTVVNPTEATDCIQWLLLEKRTV